MINIIYKYYGIIFIILVYCYWGKMKYIVWISFVMSMFGCGFDLMFFRLKVIVIR